MMTLYGYWRSSASYRVRIALALKGVRVNHVAVNLRDGEQKSKAHIARNPQGYVPVLELEDGTQLTQSLAIIDYLDAAYEANPLMPNDAVARSKILAASLTVASDISPIQNLSVLKYVRGELGADDAAVTAWAAHWIAKGFGALEERVSKNTKPFYLSGHPSIFEICLVPQMYNARRFGVDMTQYPALLALEEKCQKLPAFVAALPENQPDAPKA